MAHEIGFGHILMQMGLVLFRFVTRNCPEPSQTQETNHLASSAVDQINLIRTLGTYTETSVALSRNTLSIHTTD